MSVIFWTASRADMRSLFIMWRSAQSKLEASLLGAAFTALERNSFASSSAPFCSERRIIPMSASWFFSSFSRTCW